MQDTTLQTGLDLETRQIILSSVRDFGRRELPDDLLQRLDEESTFPQDLVRRLIGPDMGLHLLFIPEEQGGMGAGARDICDVCEALASIDLGVATSVLATALGTDPIRVGATKEQKDLWLSRIAEEGLLVAYGVTEPGAGSNVASLKARAERVEENGEVVGYRITGTKRFITNGGVADLYTILAKTPNGPSFFVVEAGTEGLTPGKEENKHGIRASNTAEVILEDLFVPTDHLLGLEEGQGLIHASRVFGYTRLMVAAFAVGAAADAMRRAVEYARDRIQFQTPLITKQGYTHKLIVPHIVALQAARAYIQQTAERLDADGKDHPVEASAAKLFAAENAAAAADAAVQALGGYGYIKEYLVEKIRRDVKITTIYEGTSEIQREIVGRGRWKDLLAGKGKLYEDLAEEMTHIERQIPGATGASAVATSAVAYLDLVRRCRKARLGRRQHVIFELGEMAAWIETSAALVRKAAKLQKHNEGAAFWPEAMAAMAKIQSSRTAAKVALTATEILQGTRTERLGQEGGFDAMGLLMAQTGTAEALDLLGELVREEDLLADPVA